VWGWSLAFLVGKQTQKFDVVSFYYSNKEIQNFIGKNQWCLCLENFSEVQYAAITAYSSMHSEHNFFSFLDQSFQDRSAPNIYCSWGQAECLLTILTQAEPGCLLTIQPSLPKRIGTLPMCLIHYQLNPMLGAKLILHFYHIFTFWRGDSKLWKLFLPPPPMSNYQYKK
jgi:hypothetical protein